MAGLDQCYNIEDLRLLARRRLPKGVFDYIDRGSEDEVALAGNRAAFQRIKLESRFLVDLSARDLGTTLFGKPVAFPLAIAPTGIAGLCWHRGELALARAAAAAGVPFALSLGSLTPMAEIARVPDIRAWFQLYVWRETQYSFELAARAGELGFEALVVTIDTALGRNREHNDRNGFGIPFRLNRRAAFDIARRPRWLAGVLGRYLATSGLPVHANYPEPYKRLVRFGRDTRAPENHSGMTWDDLKRMRDAWPRIFIVKGVLSPRDAEAAVDCGADAVVVSNHGGRALDSAPPTIEVLPAIVDAVAGRAAVLLDSGVRRGSDIAKALALGAQAVLVGRAPLYGVAAGGELGAARALELLRSEFEKTMGYMGCRTVDEVGPSNLARPPVALMGEK